MIRIMALCLFMFFVGFSLIKGQDPSVSSVDLKFGETDWVKNKNGVKYSTLITNTNKKWIQFGDSICVNYFGYLSDSTVFENRLDSSKSIRIVFMKGFFNEGFENVLFKMNAYSRIKVNIPSELGYDTVGLGRIPPNSDLNYFIVIGEVWKKKKGLWVEKW